MFVSCLGKFSHGGFLSLKSGVALVLAIMICSAREFPGWVVVGWWFEMLRKTDVAIVRLELPVTLEMLLNTKGLVHSFLSPNLRFAFMSLVVPEACSLCAANPRSSFALLSQNSAWFVHLSMHSNASQILFNHQLEVFGLLFQSRQVNEVESPLCAATTRRSDGVWSGR
jgi:hypothetical protein